MSLAASFFTPSKISLCTLCENLKINSDIIFIKFFRLLGYYAASGGSKRSFGTSWTRPLKMEPTVPKRLFQTTSCEVITHRKKGLSTAAAEAYDLVFIISVKQLTSQP